MIASILLLHIIHQSPMLTASFLWLQCYAIPSLQLRRRCNHCTRTLQCWTADQLAGSVPLYTRIVQRPSTASGPLGNGLVGNAARCDLGGDFPGRTAHYDESHRQVRNSQTRPAALDGRRVDPTRRTFELLVPAKKYPWETGARNRIYAEHQDGSLGV